jgi:hypothetical protein
LTLKGCGQQVFGQDHSAPKLAPKERLSLLPMQLKPLLGAITQASVAGRRRSWRKLLKDRRVTRRDQGKVVQGLVATAKGDRDRFLPSRHIHGAQRRKAAESAKAGGAS